MNLNELFESIGSDIRFTEVEIDKPETDDIEKRILYAEKVLSIEPERETAAVTQVTEDQLDSAAVEAVPAQSPEEGATDDE